MEARWRPGAQERELRGARGGAEPAAAEPVFGLWSFARVAAGEPGPAASGQGRSYRDGARGQGGRGRGCRTIAAELDWPPSTARGWLRRFASGAERVRAEFTALLVALVLPALPAPAASVFGDVVPAIAALATATARWSGMGGVSRCVSHRRSVPACCGTLVGRQKRSTRVGPGMGRRLGLLR
jgi:hypothetical protein